MVIAVTGASGQLGQAIQHIVASYPQIQFFFASSAQADITSLESLKSFFSEVKPDYVINAAAYTAVDRAETEPEKAFLVNATGAANVALTCREHNAVLVHISTDFVFDGTKTRPYTEDDIPNPQNVYGHSKLKGEQEIISILPEHYIIRTSWVYSQFGHNFFKTMLRLGSEHRELRVVNDQIGTPTHAVSLARAIIDLILSDKSMPGTYHFSNGGQCSWYDFAKKIFEVNNYAVIVHPIPTSAYPTAAKRPIYSVLDKTKISNIGIEINRWENELMF